MPLVQIHLFSEFAISVRAIPLLWGEQEAKESLLADRIGLTSPNPDPDLNRNPNPDTNPQSNLRTMAVLAGPKNYDVMIVKIMILGK